MAIATLIRFMVRWTFLDFSVSSTCLQHFGQAWGSGFLESVLFLASLECRVVSSILLGPRQCWRRCNDPRQFFGLQLLPRFADNVWKWAIVGDRSGKGQVFLEEHPISYLALLGSDNGIQNSSWDWKWITTGGNSNHTFFGLSFFLHIKFHCLFFFGGDCFVKYCTKLQVNLEFLWKRWYKLDDTFVHCRSMMWNFFSLVNII